jgi:hypothetical protein
MMATHAPTVKLFHSDGSRFSAPDGRKRPVAASP